LRGGEYLKATPEYIVKRLCENGYDTYIVGGAVRDFLIGKNPHDEDIATSAKPEEIIELFGGHKIVTAGTYFKVTFVDGIEVATFRKDRYEGLSDKCVTVTYANNIFEDLSRRDLTINAMAFCQFTGEVVDPHGGKDDLKKRQIKFVGDPNERIFEDPNRIIRACRFLASIDGVFETETREALRKNADLVRTHVARERIRGEIMKAMKIRIASAFFNALREIDALIHVLPSIDCMYEFGDLHGRHHWESIITHSYICGDSISTKYPLTKLAGYLHDVGKPKAASWNPKTKDLRFKGHDKVGRDILERELAELKFSNKEIEFISSLTRMHMNNFASPKAARRTLKKLSDRDIPWSELYRIKLADSKANIKKDPWPLSRIRADFERIRNAFDIRTPNKFKDLEVNGHDLMNTLEIKPGPMIGKLMKYLLEVAVDEPELNNTETLLKLAKEKFDELVSQ
jgi:tRNA nucleotidyltransferase/poly(A) polymerase